MGAISGIEQEIARRLISDHGFRPKSGGAENGLTGGRCPTCQEPEAFTPPGNRVIICPRSNKCGKQTPTRDLYPDLWQEFSKRHQPTKADPNATSTAYLFARGFHPATIKGTYKQGATTAPSAKDGPKYPTVEFELSNAVPYHRLIDYTGGDKNKIMAAYQGHHWAPPGFQIGAELWLVESPIEALSIIQAGHPAASNLSAKHVPTVLLDEIAKTRCQVVIALNADKAGQDGAKKLREACEQRKISWLMAVPPDGLDWNDLLVRGQLSPERREKTLETALWRGRLTGAANAEAFFAIWQEEKNGTLFTFRGEYYVAPDKEKEFAVRISDFTLSRLYKLQLRLDSRDSDYCEVVQVTHRDGETHQVTLTGSDLAKTASLREKLLSRASVQWDGGAPELNKLLRQIRSQTVPSVRQIDLWGYDRPSGADFFHDGAHGPDGKWYPVGKDGFVTIGKHSYRLPPVMTGEEYVWKSAAPGLEILPLLQLIERAFPRRHGLLALGFYAASLFADQLAAGPNGKGGLGMFPFLSLYGDAGTGKSTLLRILSCCLGRDWEGYPVSDTNTRIGMARVISSYSNFPLVLTEADAIPQTPGSKKNGLENVINLRAAYNRGSIRTVARKTHDNSVTNIPFRATLAFGWNEEILPDEKVAARTVSFRYHVADNTPDSREALLTLENLDAEKLAGFRHRIMERRTEFLAILRTKIPELSTWFLASGVELERTAKNHAVILAGLYAVLELFVEDLHRREEILAPVCEYVREAAHHKERSLKTDPEALTHFFEQIERLLSTDDLENMSRNGDVAFSMVEAQIAATKNLMPIRVDHELLQKSIHYKKHKWPHKSEKQGKQVSCYVFRREAFPNLPVEQLTMGASE